MAGEFTKIRVKAIAKLEKYPVGTTEEDIKLGKVKEVSHPAILY